MNQQRKRARFLGLIKMMPQRDNGDVIAIISCTKQYSGVAN